MSTTEKPPLSQALSLVTFRQLREALQKLAQTVEVGADALCLTEAQVFSDSSLPLLGVDYFTVLVSSSFSAVLTGELVLAETTLLQLANFADAVGGTNACWVELTFDPEAIATFLRQLVDASVTAPTLRQKIETFYAVPQLNSATLQSEFTLQLVATLTAYPVAAMDGKYPRSPYPPLQTPSLAQQVIERTEALREAMMAAQLASNAKSEFLASMSHELRTPLTAIIGMSATLLRWSLGELSDRQRNFLQTIHDSGQHLLEMINDILELTQLEAGRAILQLNPFSLSLLVKQSLKTMQEAAARRGVQLILHLDVEPNLDRLIADPHRVKQILLNLLSNAVKFTPEGGKVTLRVFAEPHSVLIQVIDTGIGIAEHQRSLLFQKFQQLDTSYHRIYQGTGLGLALTKQLVELHNGRITVDSTVGIGSVFTVQLPVRPEVSIDPSSSPTLEIPADHPLGRIVLLESHEETANIICDMLTAAGYQVVWILEGSMAISQIEILQPIAVMADVQAPESNGYELIRHLRQNPSTQTLKIIALTAAPLDDGDRCLAAGADNFLTKPLHPEEILPKMLTLTTPVQRVN